jgi:hypothetical protein
LVATGISQGFTMDASLVNGFLHSIAGSTSAGILLDTPSTTFRDPTGVTNRMVVSGTGIAFGATLTPTINQSLTSTTSGTTLTIQAQSATGASNNGGNLVLAGGTSGSATAGLVQLQAGGINVAQISSSKLSLLKGFNQDITPITSTYPVVVTDNYIAVGVLSASITITLPNSPATGDTYEIKDVFGSALANNITISGGGANIDGATTFVIAVNYTFLTVVYTGVQWSIC